MINILPTESSSEPVNLTESPSKQQSKYFHAPITNPINSNQLNEDEENENDYINIDSNVTVTPDHPTIDIVIAFKEHLERKVTTSRTTSEISTSNIIKGRIVEGVHGEKISFDTIVEKIHRAGLYTVEVRSLRKWDKTHKLGYIYLGVGATERRLILCADDIKYKLLGNPVELKRMAESGRPGVWEPIYTLYPATGQFANWETSLYPSVEDNSFFEKRMEDIVYSEMKTNQLPSIQKFCEHGKDATMTPSLTPFQYIYLPVETFSLCQKPGLNKNNPDERKEKHVMSFMSLTALVSNAYQLCYVAKFDYVLGFVLNDTLRVWCFWIIIFFGYLFWVIIQKILPSTPSDVKLQVERSTHLATKLIYNRPDEKFETEHFARHDDLSSAEGNELVNKIFEHFFPDGTVRPSKELFGIHKEVKEDVHHLLSTILSHHLSPGKNSS